MHSITNCGDGRNIPKIINLAAFRAGRALTAYKVTPELSVVPSRASWISTNSVKCQAHWRTQQPAGVELRAAAAALPQRGRWQ